MPPIRVIVVSSICPAPTSAGEIVLHRHLFDQPGLKVEVYGAEPTEFRFGLLTRRLIGRLNRTRFRFFAEILWFLENGRWLDPYLPKLPPSDLPTVVLTVAHGYGCNAARRYANHHKLPLVTFFHDWWPDIPPNDSFLRSSSEKRFRQLYSESALVLCVSEGMQGALGPHPGARLLYPIPSNLNEIKQLGRNQPQRAEHVFRVLYFGNLGEYGPMLRAAMETVNNDPAIQLEVRGANPAWPEEFRVAMARRGLWHDFAPRSKLQAWLAGADAFLIPMAFDGNLRRRMETSFPSKLPEFAQFGKPLVIWGPEYSSAVKWARTKSSALCVTIPDAAALRKALCDLAGNSSEQQRLSEQARVAAGNEFNGTSLQQRFLTLLQNSLGSYSLTSG